MSKIGIVTVLYNSEKVLDDFFKSLDEQRFNDFSLYIIDNASSDNSLKKCEYATLHKKYPIKIFNEKENWGIAKGNNIGISAALKDGCEYILLANNDTIFDSNVISLLYEGLLQEKVEMAVPKILFHDLGTIWCAGGSFSSWRGITYHRGIYKNDNGQFDRNCLITYSPTCFMLIKAEVFDKIGLMDEKYFVYYDDSDFIWRAVIENKFKLAYIYKPIVRHKVSSCTGGSLSDFSIYYLTRNNIYFIKKNITGIKRLLAIIYRKLAFYKKLQKLSTRQREIALKAQKDAEILLNN